MKKSLLILMVLALHFALQAQAPQGISYQAALRNGSGQPLAGSSVTMRFGIYSGAGATTKVYEETQSLTTGSTGLVNCVIGKGTVTSGTFSAINWGGDQFHLKVEANTGGGFVDMGTQQLVSVPYALHSAQSASLSPTGTVTPGQITSAGATNNQVLTWNGTAWVPKDATGGGGGGGSVNPSQITAGGASNNQTLIWNGSNWVPKDISVSASQITASGASNNQVLTWNGSAWVPKDVSVSPSQITAGGAGTDQVLTWNGTAWVPKDAAGDITGVTAGTGLSGGGSSGAVTLNAQTTTALWNANQLQGVAVANTAPASGNILKHNGTAWAPGTETVTTAGTGLSITSGTINSVWTKSGNDIYNNNTANVGIGTTTPLYNLHTYASSKDCYITSEAASNTALASVMAKGNGGSGDFLGLSRYGSGYSGTAAGINLGGLSLLNSGSASNGLLLQVESKYPMYFATNSAERMRITETGAVGINTTSPNSAYKVHMMGAGTLNSNLTPYYQSVLMAEDTVSSNYGSSGIIGRGGWKGVMGHNKGVSGGASAIGVYGLTEGTSYTVAYGMRGEATGAGGSTIGVSGLSTAGTKLSFGVYGIANNSTSAAHRVGVYGSGNNTGVVGTTSGSGWTYSSIFNPMTAGVVGQVRSVTANRPVGVMGIAGTTGSSGQTALMALADSNVYNYGVEGYGLYGTGTNYGVYGYAAGTGTNYAGYFSGYLYATSSSSGVKAFRIDHPLDPENKYLSHSSVESPDMMNIYNGNVNTDADGKATIQLPSYFSALNREFRYQLTCIGQFAQAIVDNEISGNTFSIRTDKPNVRVSWMVTGIRKDATAEHNRIQVEQDKPASEKGFYLDPEAYGYGMERNAAWYRSALNKKLEYKTSQNKQEINPVALPVDQLQKK
ncbi:MAG: hypothetical protein JNL57_11635 [Bacteroidetes bacterium]|nr:hypothetical protein [Bacteroidota bacterium]